MSATSPADTPLQWLGDLGRRYEGAWSFLEDLLRPCPPEWLRLTALDAPVEVWEPPTAA